MSRTRPKILPNCATGSVKQAGAETGPVSQKKRKTGVDPIIKDVRELRDRIIKQTPAAWMFSNPAQKILLPFPSLYEQLPTIRFHLNNGIWKYMGREKFKELLKKVEELKQNPHVGLWLYGTIGYGKSHLLAALVCHLVSRGDVVFYVPDCRILARHPLRYLKAAMLLAWGINIPRAGVQRMTSLSLAAQGAVLQAIPQAVSQAVPQAAPEDSAGTWTVG